MLDIHFDFAAALVLMTAVTGLVTLLDSLWFARSREKKTLPGFSVAKPNAIIEFCRSFFPVILLVLLLRSFLVEPFRIPSGSMLPTLSIGDFILVNKYKYGLRLPVLNRKLLEIGEPERGDVVVFRFPPDPTKDYIKRIVGLPGDDIRYENKTLYINGERVEVDDINVHADSDNSVFGTRVLELSEQLGNATHLILVAPRRVEPDLHIQVPPGHYFAMGDNRDNSEDSRSWGFVPERNLVGKAFVVWMSWDITRGWPDFSRIGTRIH